MQRRMRVPVEWLRYWAGACKFEEEIRVRIAQGISNGSFALFVQYMQKRSRFLRKIKNDMSK